MNTMQQPAVTDVVKSFAKANKVSIAKLAEFAEIVRIAKPEQKISTDSKTIRKAILSMKTNFVSADLAEKLGVTTVQVNNNLFALQRKGLTKPTGEKRVTGQQGKPATIWELVNA